MNKKGITLVSLAITIVVMIILAGAITITSIDIVERGKMQQIVSDMILIQTKVKIIIEQVSFSGDTSTYYVGRKLSQQSNKAQLAGQALSAAELESNMYYVYDQTTLESIGLEGIKLSENEIYIVNYENGEVIFPKGVKNSSGEIVYKLSDMM